MLTYGTNLAVPGDLLRDPGEPFSEPELNELVKYMGKNNVKEPIPTTSRPQVEVPEPPLSVTHVYTKQHKLTGLQPSYVGPFPIVQRPSRSTVKIRVGFDKRGQPRHELRNWKDLKIAEVPEDVTEASRPKRGRPKSSIPTSVQSGPDSGDIEEAGPSSEVNNTNGAEIQTRPTRSTRNPSPIYVDSLSLSPSTGPPPHRAFSPSSRPESNATKAWSASPEDLSFINRSISGS